MTGFDFQQLFLLMKKNISYYADLIYSKYLLLIIYFYFIYRWLQIIHLHTKNHFIDSTVVIELVDVSCIASKDVAARR